MSPAGCVLRRRRLLLGYAVASGDEIWYSFLQTETRIDAYLDITMNDDVINDAITMRPGPSLALGRTVQYEFVRELGGSYRDCEENCTASYRQREATNKRHPMFGTRLYPSVKSFGTKVVWSIYPTPMNPETMFHGMTDVMFSAFAVLWNQAS